MAGSGEVVSEVRSSKKSGSKKSSSRSSDKDAAKGQDDLVTVTPSSHRKKSSKKRPASDPDLADTKESVDTGTSHGEHVDGSLIDECLNEPTMGEKLASLNLVVNNEVRALEKEENSEPSKPPSADSVHVLLKQALRADDRVLLLSCLCTRDEKVIANSVSLLKPSDILKLLQSLLSLMQSRGAVLVCCIPWIRSLLLQHASGIMSQESSLVALNSLYQLIESRVSTFQSALQMSSALDMFYAGAIDDDLEENDVITPVIFEDKDDSEEDESEDAMETDEEAGVGDGDAEPHSDVSDAEDGDFMAFDF